MSWVPARLSLSSSRLARSAVRILLNEIESVPPNSASNNRSHVSKLSGCSPVATRARSRNGAIAGLFASVCKSPATGIPTCENARRRAADCVPSERKITAISA